MDKSHSFQTRSGIAKLYNISYKTLMRHLKKADIKLPSGDISPNNQKIIFDALGYPNEEIRTEFEHFEE